MDDSGRSGKAAIEAKGVRESTHVLGEGDTTEADADVADVVAMMPDNI